MYLDQQIKNNIWKKIELKKYNYSLEIKGMIRIYIWQWEEIYNYIIVNENREQEKNHKIEVWTFKMLPVPEMT